MDKGVGVDALDGGRGALKDCLIGAQELSRNEDEERAHALPAQ